MGREVSEFLASLRGKLAVDYQDVMWLQATPASGLDGPSRNVIGTVAVDDLEEIEDTAQDRMTGAWYLYLPLVISLYFNRAIANDYELPRDFAFSVAAWFRKRAAGTPSQAVSRVGTLVRQVEINQKIEDGVDSGYLQNWLMWQIRVSVPQAIMPAFPAIPDVFDHSQGPPVEGDIQIDRVYYSTNPDATNPDEAHQLAP